MENLQILAGSISSLIFMLGTVTMLKKAWSTRDVRSYSLGQLVLNNIGNLVHWLYISSLPFGPIWLLHGFFTISTILMLIWCIMYRYAPEAVEKRTTETLQRVTQTTDIIVRTMEIPKLTINDQRRKTR